MRSIHRAVLAGTIMLTLAATIGVAGASAEECKTCVPWWHVTTLSAPAEEAGGEGQVVVEATNLGDKAADGRFSPMTVVDTLPAGVEPTAVFGEGGGGQSGDREEKEKTEEKLGHSNCAIAGQVVTCVYEWPLMPYERLSVAIDVKVTPGAGTGLNAVSVSGGGPAAVNVDRSLAMESPAPSFGVQNYEVAPEEEGGAVDTRAGSHPFQMTTTFALNARMAPIVNGKQEHVREVQPPVLTKDLRFELPPGLIGNPTALPKCNIFVFTEEAKQTPGFKCPNDTVVGVATSIVQPLSTDGAANVPGTLTVPLYNLEPSFGEPARFGFATPADVGVLLDTSVRTGGDYGVTVTVSNATQLVAFIGSQVTFWGAPSDSRHDTQRGTGCLAGIAGSRYVKSGVETSCPLGEAEQPFLIMPTSCVAPASTNVEADSWSQPGQFTGRQFTFQDQVGEPFSFDGCNKLNFDPSISVTPDLNQASTATGLKVGVHVAQDASLNPLGTAEAPVKDTTVTLPEGVTLNPGGADGLEACSEAEIGFQGREAQAGVLASSVFTPSLPEPMCPDGAKVGTVEIETPLLPKVDLLKGAVYLASPAPNGEAGRNPFRSLIAMYIVAEDPVSGTLIKLAGMVVADPNTGRLTTTFQDTPQLPFENLRLHFFGGARAPLSTPPSCGSYVTGASFAPWSEPGHPVMVSSPPFEITSGANGVRCQNPLPFAPSLTSGSVNIQAGALTPFTMTMSREDGNQNLDAIQLRMPPGLSGLLTGVKLCSEAQGNAGTCGPESEIGETTVSVGLGGNPYTVTGGKVYITGPYEGAPFGLSIVNPAKAGPFDLGKVVVRAKIEVDPTTAVLTITSDTTGPYSIPQILDGIPLEIKHVNVTINRPSFTFNPTNCAPMSIGGSLTSSQGAVAGLHVPFQVTNCATLAFKPGFEVSTAGKTSRAKGASLNVKLTYPKAPFGSQANIKSVKVDLPKQLPSRLTTLQKACPDSTFNQNPAACQPASRVGTGTATTPLIPVPLSGPAYFVSHGGAKFPELIVVLSGYGVTLDLHGETFISKAGITSSTFRTVPDAPVGTFELKLPQGPDSALAANGNLCKSALRMPTAFTAQNGAVIKQSTPITATGCGKQKHKKSKKASRYKRKK